MARGGKGGRRGGSRGRGTSFAQSGGKSSSWADTKQGAGTIGSTGGSRDSVVGGMTHRGNKVTVRNPAGQNNKTGLSRSNQATVGGVKRGAPSALSGSPKPKTSGSTKRPYAKLRKGQVRGAGGSRG
jgi:hypothetical protein